MMQCTEVRFASLLSGGFTTVINPPEKKLANRTSVQWSISNFFTNKISQGRNWSVEKITYLALCGYIVQGVSTYRASAYGILNTLIMWSTQISLNNFQNIWSQCNWAARIAHRRSKPSWILRAHVGIWNLVMVSLL